MPKPPALTLHTRADLTTPTDAIKEAKHLPLDLIDPNPAQARQVFDTTALNELAASITAQGVIQPIVVRPVGDRYQIVAGERRYKAARIAGLTSIPAIIRAYTDQDAAYVTAVENLQRADLDIEDEGRQYEYLLTLTGLSQRELAKQLGVNHEYLSRRVRLLKRPDLMAHVRAGALTLKAALSALVENERLTEAVFAPALSHGETLTERADMDSTPPTAHQRTPAAPHAAPPSPPYYRPIQQAMTALERLRPADVPTAERATWAAQLRELRATVDAQLDALEAD